MSVNLANAPVASVGHGERRRERARREGGAGHRTTSGGERGNLVRRERVAEDGELVDVAGEESTISSGGQPAEQHIVIAEGVRATHGGNVELAVDVERHLPAVQI